MPAPNASALRSQLPAPRASVIAQQLPDGAILYCPEQELYFGLNRTGACIWEHLSPTCSTIDEVCHKVLDRFANAELATVRNHVEHLLARLGEHRLLSSIP